MKVEKLAHQNGIGRAGPKASILETVGRTPVVRLNNIGPKSVELYVKLESFNPLGSVKDRLAVGIIEAAERSGELKPGQTVIEATSGNTGIGLAMVCAQKGYPLVIVMAENFSVERRRLMRFLGAKVVLTPASGKGSGMLAKARELAAEHGWFLCRQFETPVNAETHANTTAREILEDFSELGLDYWITGHGTGGTLQGVAGVLKKHSPRTRIVVAEPDNSAVLASGLPQPGPDENGVPLSHPAFRPHLMQGWSPDFVSPIAQASRDEGLIDRFVPVSGDEALASARDLAAREGILVGISAGATLAAALVVARLAPPGSKILAMMPDTGERYISTQLFDNVSAEMTAEEAGISESTPGFRINSPGTPGTPGTPGASELPVAVDADAAAFVENEVYDSAEPIVMFALEWCEFSQSLRRLFAAAGIAYRSVDLDAATFPGGSAFANQVRRALHAKIGSPTIPQVFAAGVHLGGATEAIEAFDDGTLGKLLCESGQKYDGSAVTDARSFLPTWLHSRGKPAV